MKDSNDDPLLQALVFLGMVHARPVSPEGACQGLPLSEGKLTPDLFHRAASRCGFESKTVHRPLHRLHSATLPAVLLLQDNDAVILTGFPEDDVAEVIVLSAGNGAQRIPVSELDELYSGLAILAKPVYEFEARASFRSRRSEKHWFWGTLWKFRSFYARVASATLVINLLALASSIFVMNVYDRVVPNEATDTLFVLAAGVVIAYLFEFALKSLRTFFVDRAGHRIDLILGGELFSRILGMKFGNRPASAGSLASQARSYEGLREFFTSATVAALIDLPFVFFFIAVIFLLGGGVVALPLLIGVILALSASFLIQIPIGHSIGDSYRSANQRQALFVEGIQALETIKSTRSESEMQARMEETVLQSSRAESRSRGFSQMALNFTGLIQHLVSTGIVIAAFYQVIDEKMTMGAMIACVILAGRAMAPLNLVASLLSRLQQSRKALQGLNEIMETPVERDDRGSRYLTVEQFLPELQVRNLKFAYSQDTDPVIDSLDLTIRPGERVALLGSIGSGKSTLLRLLMGLYEPGEGRIDLSGIDIRQIDPAELRQHLGYVPQDPNLLFGTLRTNLKAGCPWISDARLLKAIERAGLAEFIRSLPRGIDQPVAEGGRSLSGANPSASLVRSSRNRRCSFSTNPPAPWI